LKTVSINQKKIQFINKVVLQEFELMSKAGFIIDFHFGLQCPIVYIQKIKILYIWFWKYEN